MNQELINFYSGNGVDASGRSIYDIFSFTHDQLEGVHDYIQWLFPLNEASSYNPNAPLLDEETIEAFTNNVSCMEHLAEATEHMLYFYFGCKGKDGEFFLTEKPEWCYKGDHNYLRLTRIMRSLKLLNQDELAFKFYKLLVILFMSYPEEIGLTTFNFWRDAALPVANF